MIPLKKVLPACDKLLYIFYDFKTTQNTRFSDRDTLHVPNLFCVQQFCSMCEDVEAARRKCVQCGERKQSIYVNRALMLKIVAIAHNAKSFDIHFVLNRAVLLKWQPVLIMNGMKIMFMKM